MTKFIKVTQTEFAGYGTLGYKVYEEHDVFINPKHIKYVEEAKYTEFPKANTTISCIDMDDFYVTETLEQVMSLIERN